MRVLAFVVAALERPIPIRVCKDGTHDDAVDERHHIERAAHPDEIRELHLVVEHARCSQRHGLDTKRIDAAHKPIVLRADGGVEHKVRVHVHEVREQGCNRDQRRQQEPAHAVADKHHTQQGSRTDDAHDGLNKWIVDARGTPDQNERVENRAHQRKDVERDRLLHKVVDAPRARLGERRALVCARTGGRETATRGKRERCGGICGGFGVDKDSHGVRHHVVQEVDEERVEHHVCDRGRCERVLDAFPEPQTRASDRFLCATGTTAIRFLWFTRLL